VWVGLGLTLIVAWWTTKSSVAAGQATAQGVIAAQAGTGPGASSGLGQEIGTLQGQMVTSIGDLQRQQTSLANAIGTPQDVTAGNQSSLFGAMAAQNSTTQQGIANVNTALGTLQTSSAGNLQNSQSILDELTSQAPMIRGVYNRSQLPSASDFYAQPAGIISTYVNATGGDFQSAAQHWANDAGAAVLNFQAQSSN
jgi:hypothetical protein